MVHNSCNMCTRGLPDMNTLSLWLSGFRCIYQANHSCPCYNYSITCIPYDLVTLLFKVPILTVALLAGYICLTAIKIRSQI